MMHLFSPHRRAITHCLLLALACLAWMGGLPAAHAASVQSATREAPIRGLQGLWVWRDTSIATAEARAELLAFCEQWGYNRLLVQIHRERSGDRTALRLPDALADLIAQAAERGIRVEALDGAPDMAFAEQQPHTLAILESILTFNRSLPEGKRFAGIHYDIEPYVLPAWKQDDATRQTIMRDLLEFYQKVRDRLAQDGTGLTLSADIPFWYDRKTEEGDSCMITFGGEHKNLHKHIQDLCDYIGIMSYRRNALGRNSVVEVIQDELEYAASIGKTITPALETIELREDAIISFHGLPASVFWREHQLVIDTLQDHPGFGGILTHSYDGLRKLIADSAHADTTGDK